MMQPTPAPTEAPNSPGPTQDHALQTQTYPTPPQNIGPSPPFGVLVGLFEKLSLERKHDRRRKMLDAWFTHYREQVGNDLYPVLRLILPQKDRERAVYNLKEKNLAKVYIKLLNLPPKDSDSMRLLFWKKPLEKNKTAGDFATVLKEVVHSRSSVLTGRFSVEQVNDILDQLAESGGKLEKQMRILRDLNSNTTAIEQAWVARIILKDMVISVKETTVFSVFHPDAQDLFNTCSDLKKVAWELWDTSRKLNAEDKAIQLFHSFAPMLCKRPLKKIEDTVKEMGGTEFIIEEKLDGERMQLHKRGNEYFYCSRKGKDYTYLYGKHLGTGSLTPFIHSAFDPRVDEIILDGEMLVWDPVSERNLPFGTLKTAAGDQSKLKQRPRPCFKVFDLLYLNGQSLAHRSTAFRKKNMRGCLSEVKGRIEFCVEYKGKTASDIRKRMDEVMENRGEGLVIKHASSKYVLNGRNMDWIKVKPEYMDNLGETVDVSVIGGNYGTGKRSGGVSTLICAVLDDRTEDPDSMESKYSTFVRIGSGLSYSDYQWIREKPWKQYNPKKPPEFLQTAKRGQEDKPDVYLEPEDSFIVKVKAAEITPSDQYFMGYTMRFPRALSVRDDLDKCMTASEVFESVRSEKKRKMETHNEVSNKKRKTKVVKKIEVLPQYRGVSKKGVQVESNIFEGMKFVVMSDPKSRTGEADKKSLTKLIYANGGDCAQVAKEQEGLFVVYGGTIVPYDLKLVVNKNTIDVLKPKWITDSVDQGEALPMTKKYFFHASENRLTEDDYAMDEDEEEKEQAQDPEAAAAASPGSVTEDDDDDLASTSKNNDVSVKTEELDPETEKWTKIDNKKDTKEPVPYEDSVTEDSDNADLADDPEEEAEDDWYQVNAGQDSSTLESEKSTGKKPVTGADDDVKMGESATAMEYDTDLIFKHLCFYIDSVENASKNGISIKPNKREEEIRKRLSEIEKLISDNGGRVVGLDEPKLTHVVVDSRDDSRRLELMRRTAKPKRRHLVISEYIEACMEEGTLLDEDGFAP